MEERGLVAQPPDIPTVHTGAVSRALVENVTTVKFIVIIVIIVITTVMTLPQIFLGHLPETGANESHPLLHGFNRPGRRYCRYPHFRYEQTEPWVNDLPAVTASTSAPEPRQVCPRCRLTLHRTLQGAQGTRLLQSGITSDSQTLTGRRHSFCSPVW